MQETSVTNADFKAVTVLFRDWCNFRVDKRQVALWLRRCTLNEMDSIIFKLAEPDTDWSDDDLLATTNIPDLVQRVDDAVLNIYLRNKERGWEY